MAFSKEEHDNLLREIYMTGGATPAMDELFQKLRDDFDEREGELRRYHEERDKAEPEGSQAEEEKIREESAEDNREDGGERRDPIPEGMVSREDLEKVIAERDSFKKAYLDRFFSNPNTAKEAIEDQKENVEEDGERKPFEDLFRDREGN